MRPDRTLPLLGAAAAALLGGHLVHDLLGFGAASFDRFFALWFQPFVFLASGAVTLAGAFGRRHERAAWLLIGCGLVLYASGSVLFNVAYSGDASPPFPSVADALWLALYPLAASGIALLVRARFPHVTFAVWLDGLIAGFVVAGLAAAVVFEPVFDVTVANGTASVARLGYPVGDVLCLGLIVAVWSMGGRRDDRSWLPLGAAFALLAAADSVYVVEAARGAWAPGGVLDLPYAAATMLLAAAAWTGRGAQRATGAPAAPPVLLPGVFAMLAVALVGYATIGEMNALATALSLVALLVVVIRFALSLASLTRQSDALATLAATDPLTGLANHRTLHDRLAQETERARRDATALSVVALDIDHFKVVNDTYGHSAGDAALKAISQVLRDEVRPYDVVGRLGGEEFVLILPGADGGVASAVAERCRLALLELVVPGAPISCSAGVAAYPEDDADGQHLLELADGALYWAKRSGRAQVKRFDPLHVTALSSSEQHAQVRDVMRRDDGLTMVFQPIVEVATGRIGGYEALSRFRAGAQPARTPDVWFAQARRCGLGDELEARAVASALAVPGRPAGTFLSLNLSPTALMSPHVAAVLPHDLHDVVIEITEGELAAHGDALDVQIAALRARGARIAVDDAGAGYAGLQQVIRIKPDILKIDRSLVRGVHSDAAKIALLDALSRFAVSTGAAVCAEGIEEADELLTLARLDVTYAQGYALGRPGVPWPSIDADLAAGAAARPGAGMRLAPAAVSGDGPATLGDAADALARLRSVADIRAARTLLERLEGSDALVVSRVLPDEACVETLNNDDWSPAGDRYHYADFPTTERVVVDQVTGQIVAGDPAADAAELRLLEEEGMGAVLMAPLVYRGRTIGLLELFRRSPRPWTRSELDDAGILANHIATALHHARIEWMAEGAATKV